MVFSPSVRAALAIPTSRGLAVLALLVVAALLANFVAGIVRGAASEMGFGSPSLMANIARYAILTFAVVAAINQLGIAPTVVNTLLIGTVGAVALALGLAFGLGGRDVAARITEGWYASSQAAAEKVRLAAEDDTAPPKRSAASGETKPSRGTA